MMSFYTSIFLLVQNCNGCKTKFTNNVEELGIFAKCQNKWCLQKGLEKPQYTKCESVENKGKTCINPEIKYGATTVGLPMDYSENIHYGKWCGQLGGWYVDHTIGRRTGYILEGCTGYNSPGDPWHWCDYNFFNQPLTNHTTSNDFITSITCNRITNNCEEPNNVMEEANNGVEEPNKVEEESNNVKAEPINIVNQGVLSAYFELILKAQIKLFSRPLNPNKEVEEPNNAVKELNNVVEKPNSIVDEPNNEMEDPNNLVQEPHSVHCVLEEPNYELEEPGIFAKCQNEWCLQKGLQKPQHTKCESVTNNGKTCNNPEIKYGTVTGGLPWEYPSNNYEKWCEQLGGLYAAHTFGRRTGYQLYGCTGYDDPENWLAVWRQNPALAIAFLDRLDGAFKHDLDRYKYASRYNRDAGSAHRDIGGTFLTELDQDLQQTGALSGPQLGLLDFASLPFVRQFRIADPDWFDNQSWPHLHAWLGGFLDSASFRLVMQKYPQWSPDGQSIAFPSQP